MADGSLPQPCPECLPYGGNWRLEVKDGLERMVRCNCDRGRELARREALQKARPVAHPPILTDRGANSALNALAAMPFFPREKEGRLLIANELRSMVGAPGDTPAQAAEKVRWLVTRMCRLYAKWPGIGELRAVYCSHIGAALDGVPALPSAVFEGGVIPVEAPAEQPAPVPALPPGDAYSADLKLEASVRALAPLKAMPKGMGPLPRPGERILNGIAERDRRNGIDVLAGKELWGETGDGPEDPSEAGE